MRRRWFLGLAGGSLVALVVPASTARSCPPGNKHCPPTTTTTTTTPATTTTMPATTTTVADPGTYLPCPTS